MSRNIDEVELGKFLGCIDIIPLAFRAAASETCSIYKLHTSPSGIQILAFKNCSSDCISLFAKGEFKLVSSQNNKVVDFISSSEVNSSFSVNEAAVDMFESIPSALKQLKDKLIERPLIVTGRGLGGYAAVLFALWLHHAVDVKESNDEWTSKRPVCITFGCPLVGDKGLQCIISKYPQWESRFLNVVAKDECFTSFYSSISEYKPFGTFLFCSESGERTTSQDPDMILDVLNKMGSSGAENMMIQDYGKCLSEIRRKTLYRGVSEAGEHNKMEYFDDPFGKMKEKQTKKIYDHKRKLNDMKIKMVNIEGYMKMMASEFYGGIYDFYRKPFKNGAEIEIQNKITKHVSALTTHWTWFVYETQRKPQKEDAKMRKSWVLNGHNYRRMIEQFGIARYYKNGNRDYIANRPPHYVILEELLKKYTKPGTEDYQKDTKSSEVIKRNKAASLTEDSCFWAHVEEAKILLRDLVDGGSAGVEETLEKWKKLEKFEAYVMFEIKKYSVSPDIFLQRSSLMMWWKEYKAHKGTEYASEFAQYMNNKSYESYH